MADAVGAGEVKRVRRALGLVEDWREQFALMSQATAQAADGEVEVALLAQRASDHLRNVGPVSALELLARLGWWMIEAEIDVDARVGDRRGL